jgi:putative redox protein
MTLIKKMTIDWTNNYCFVAHNEKGLTVNFDAPIAFGGEESALSPMENLLASVATCSSIHLISLLKEQGKKLSEYSVEIQAEREEEPPRTFTKINLHYIIKGKNLSRTEIKEAVETAEGNHWSVGTMLKKAVPITSSFEIIETQMAIGGPYRI